MSLFTSKYRVFAVQNVVDEPETIGEVLINDYSTRKPLISCSYRIIFGEGIAK